MGGIVTNIGEKNLGYRPHRYNTKLETYVRLADIHEVFIDRSKDAAEQLRDGQLVPVEQYNELVRRYNGAIRRLKRG